MGRNIPRIGPIIRDSPTKGHRTTGRGKRDEGFKFLKEPWGLSLRDDFAVPQRNESHAGDSVHGGYAPCGTSFLKIVTCNPERTHHK